MRYTIFEPGENNNRKLSETRNLNLYYIKAAGPAHLIPKFNLIKRWAKNSKQLKPHAQTELPHLAKAWFKKSN